MSGFEMKAKEDYINQYMSRMTEEDLVIESEEGKKDFIRNLVATNIVMEGIWFYSGFMVMMSFRQRNKLRNFGSMINWVIRDESLHLKFGMNLIMSILEENDELLTEEFANEIRDIVIQGVDLEVTYNKDLFPKGILGLNADYVNQYVQYVADRRLEELGLESLMQRNHAPLVDSNSSSKTLSSLAELPENVAAGDKAPADVGLVRRSSLATITELEAAAALKLASQSTSSTAVGEGASPPPPPRNVVRRNVMRKHMTACLAESFEK
jgi:hypothetical protein